MARSYSLGEGFAKEGRWIAGSRRTVVLQDVLGKSYKATFHSLSREDASQERLEQLEKLRAESEVSFPVFRGMEGFEVLDSKAAEAAVREERKGLDSKRARLNQYHGSAGDGLFHFAKEVGHSLNYARHDTDWEMRDNTNVADLKSGDSTTGVVEGVLVSKKLLDLREIGPSLSSLIPDAPKFSLSNNAERSEYHKNELKKKDDFYAKNSDKPPYFINESETADYQDSLYQMYKAKWVDKIVDAISNQYQSKFGKPMPDDIHISKSSKSSSSVDGSVPYANLRNSIYNDPWLKKGDLSYMILKTKAFKNIFKNSGFDAVAYLDRAKEMTHESIAVKSPNQFKAYAGDKPVNLKSDNIFDAD